MLPIEWIDAFKDFCEATNCPEWMVKDGVIILFLSSVGIVVLGFLSSIFWTIVSVAKRIILWKNQRTLNRDLNPYYSRADVEKATRYFVPVKYQNVAPSEDDELGSRYIASAKNSIMPLFLNRAFKNDRDDNKYYLVLADAGMGKTTFLINLYIAYKNAWSCPLSMPKHEIRLLPLSYPHILDEIEGIENKENTILLLDAFDEDIEAAKDYKARLKLLLSKVNKFREIVVTCRTQFFPSRDEEPVETGYYSAGEGGEYRFQKIYLSVFDNRAVKKYLRKRYAPYHRIPLFKSSEYKRAQKIAEKSPTLVVRPMLLSHIRELAESENTYEFSFQIYEELIDKWIERESRKPRIKEKFGSEEILRDALFKFSEKLAIHLYNNREKHGGYFLPMGESFDEGILNIADVGDGDFIFSEKIGKSKSLLNRDAAGNYKFSHKSILEFFIAKECFRDYQFHQIFDANGMDLVQHFAKEMLIESLRNMSGGFVTNDKLKKTNRENSQAYLAELIPLDKLTKIENIKVLILKDFTHLNIPLLGYLIDVNKIVFHECPKLYFVYRGIYYLHFAIERIKLALKRRLKILPTIDSSPVNPSRKFHINLFCKAISNKLSIVIATGEEFWGAIYRITNRYEYSELESHLKKIENFSFNEINQYILELYPVEFTNKQLFFIKTFNIETNIPQAFLDLSGFPSAVNLIEESFGQFDVKFDDEKYIDDEIYNIISPFGDELNAISSQLTELKNYIEHFLVSDFANTFYEVESFYVQINALRKARPDVEIYC